jgi:predicted ATP-dependent serine protease
MEIGMSVNRPRQAPTTLKLVRAVKNRFGAANEFGVLAMTDKGLRGVTKLLVTLT